VCSNGRIILIYVSEESLLIKAHPIGVMTCAFDVELPLLYRDGRIMLI